MKGSATPSPQPPHATSAESPLLTRWRDRRRWGVCGSVDLVDEGVAFARQHGARVPSRELARQVHRPETHAHQPADDDAARRPPMPNLRGARGAHRDVEPVIEPFAVLRGRLQNAHGLALAVRGGAKFLDELILERSAHPQYI